MLLKYHPGSTEEVSATTEESDRKENIRETLTGRGRVLNVGGGDRIVIGT